MNPFVLLIVAVLGIAMYQRRRKNSLVEFFMPPLTYRVDSTPAEAERRVRNENIGLEYTAPRNRTSLLSPRIGNVSYGASINVRPPEDSGMLAVDPLNPLGVGSDGDIQPVMYDRFVYAPKQSRLSKNADNIRGDLPIKPNEGNWFVPSVNPHIDLRDGAMNVLAGQYNDTANELGAYKYALTRGAYNIYAGAPYEPTPEMVRVSSSQVPLYQETLNRVGDVIVSTLPRA